MRRSLVYECDEKKAAEQYQHPSAPAKRYPIVSRHWNLAGLIDESRCLPEHANPEAEADQKRCKEDHGYIDRKPPRDAVSRFDHAVTPRRFLGEKQRKGV